MSELIRDTVFGHILRFLTKGKVLQYAEEKDPSLWKQYLDRDQTKHMALYGHTGDETPEEKQERESSPTDGTQSSGNGNGNGKEAKHSDESSRSCAEGGEPPLSSTITGQKIDPEKGRDTTIVTWYGDNDQEVPFT